MLHIINKLIPMSKMLVELGFIKRIIKGIFWYEYTVLFDTFIVHS